MWGHRFDPRSECCAAAKPERSNSWTSALCSAIRKGTSARSLHTIGSEQPCSLQPKKSPHGNEDPAGPKITNAWVLSHFSSVQSLSCVWLFATPWIAARQASLSLTISRSSLKLTSIRDYSKLYKLGRVLWEPPVYNQLAQSTSDNLELPSGISSKEHFWWDWVFSLWGLC